MERVMPILKHKSELELQQKRGMFIDFVIDKPASPLIMYGEDVGGAMSYTPSEGTEADSKLKANALVNLWCVEVDITLQDVDGTQIAVIGHEYAAEKILDPTFLIKLADALGSEQIAVGIPMKCALIASSIQSATELQNATLNLYENNNTYPISDAIFLVSGGAVLAISGGS